jgi:hypothetical protein
MTIDKYNNIWYYYYSDFNLVKTNFQTIKSFHPNIKGSKTIFVKDSGDYVCLEGGYSHSNDYYAFHIEEEISLQREKVNFVYENNIISNFEIICRGSKILLIDSESNLYLVNWR